VQAVGEHGGQEGNQNAAKDKEKNEGDNITFVSPKRGTGRTYTLRRLKRDRPDLAAKVTAGEISANAAALEAGIRKKIKWVCPKCGCEAVRAESAA
jgi:hypothetical protein